MWAIRSHMVANLTKIISSKVKFIWTKIEQYVFEEIKRILAHGVLLDYPDFNVEFNIHTNVSDLQLGAVIIQNVKPIGFYSRKLMGSQMILKVT